MTWVTIRVLEGMEQGRVYSRLPLPISVGREDENNIQLNDDRISRFHAKLQDHSGRVILTDLDSTNGTRVNGHAVQMRVLQPGDIIAVGRCLLLLSEQEDSDLTPIGGADQTFYAGSGITYDDSKDDDCEFFAPLPRSPEEPVEPFQKGCPELPIRLDALQRVQLSDLLSYVHEQIGRVVRNSIQEIENPSPEELVLDNPQERVFRCDWENWSHLVALHAKLAECVCAVNNPDHS
ncbi:MULTISPECIES: FHA domain-containing protein [unclassified Schlesneria]|uniref:FHA domain-containing protein n=1 Tax=Schlesneria TaxID=656899 RepID=UPI002EF42BF1